MIKKILCAMLGLLFTISANAACNLYNKDDGALTGYPSEGMKWTTGGSEKSILIKLTEGETYTIRRVDGSGAVLRIAASSTDTLTAGQSLQRIYVGSRDETVKTFSVPDGYPYVLIYVYNTNGMSITPKQAIDGFMIVKGSEIPDEYIPYDVACINRCKNLFDKAQTPYNSGTYISSATVGQTGFSTDVNTNYNVYRVEIQPSTTYTFGLIKANSPKWVVTDANNVVLDTGANNGGEAGTSITITTGATAKYLYLSVSVNEKYKCIDILQLEQGDVATEYVPYNAACHNNKITIATTKYNETKFSPLNTALANAISVVDSVVSNTITQAGRIATLQAQKQTRPNDIADDNEKCPAGKKCLLVEDASGVPHWYEIVERYSLLPDGYTELEYITFNGTQELDTGFTPNQDTRIESKIYGATNANMWIYGTGVSNPRITAYLASSGNQRFGNKTVDSTGITGETLATIVQDKNVFNWNGNTKTYDSQSNFTALTSLTIGNSNGSTGTPYFSGNFYYMKIYDNEILVRDYVPAQDSNNNVGLFDRVNNVFLTAEGLVAGAIVE